MGKGKGPRTKRGPDRKDIGPWRLGLSIGGKTGRSESTMAIGWAVLKLQGPPSRRSSDRRGVEYFEDDPVAAIIRAAETQAAIRGDAPPEYINLTRYRSEASFAGSRAAAEGMALTDHQLMIARVATELRARGFTVRFDEQ